jgi:Leucine-rich repeat (LRR) protein
VLTTPLFASLTSLDLSFNFISTIPLSLSALTDLRSLDLSHNLLAGSLPAQLAESLALLTQLVRLNLAHNELHDLSALPSQQLRSLEELDVSYNGLEAIPAHVIHLTRLRHLNLAGNAFIGEGKKGQLEVVHSLTTLTWLNLADNEIASLSPRFFSSLARLEHLDLTGCGLTKLPMGIGHLAKLRVLCISNNSDLRGFPSDFWSLSSLVELYAR